MTTWGILLIVAFMVMGLLPGRDLPRGWRVAAFVGMVITAVTVGAL